MRLIHPFRQPARIGRLVEENRQHLAVPELLAPYCVLPRPGGVDIGIGVPLARARALSNSSIVSRALGVGSPVGLASFLRRPVSTGPCGILAPPLEFVNVPGASGICAKAMRRGNVSKIASAIMAASR
jgi:hypothetical protein